MYLTLSVDLNLRPHDRHLNSRRNCVCIKIWPARDSDAKSAKYIISVVYTIFVVVKLSEIKLLQNYILVIVKLDRKCMYCESWKKCDLKSLSHSSRLCSDYVNTSIRCSSKSDNYRGRYK